MSEVTVKAVQPVLGLPDGKVVTVERTDRVDGAIRAGMLEVVGEPAGEPDTGGEAFIPAVPDAAAADAEDQRTDSEREADEQAAAARKPRGKSPKS